MPTDTSKAVSTGPSAKLISRVQHLERLIRHLPATLPLDPPDAETTYNFGLDQDEVKEEGVVFALTQNLERCFRSHALAPGQLLRFAERGKRCETLIKLLKDAMRNITSEDDRVFVSEIWVERLIVAAKESGAKIPPKRRSIVSSDSEPDDSRDVPTTAIQSSSPISTVAAPIEVDSSDTETEARSRQQTHHPSTKRARTIVTNSDSKAPPKQTVSARMVQITLTGSRVPSKSTSSVKHRRATSPAPNRGTLDTHVAQFQSMTTAEQRESVARAEERMRENREHILRKEEEMARKKKAHQQELNRARQQRWAERQKKAKGDHRVTRQVKHQLLGFEVPTSEATDLAAISRPEGAKWKKNRNGAKKGVAQGTHVRTNYFHPFLWPHINRVARSVNFSATLTAKILSTSPATKALFPKIRKGTIQAWLSKHGKRWSSHTLKKVANRGALAGSGRVGFLKKYPEIVNEVKEKLVGLRVAGVSVNRMLGRAIFLAVIRKRDATILETFKCSEWFVGQFYASVLDWSVRKGTRAAAHIPANASDLCERTFFRVVHLSMVYDIPAKLWINIDQLGMYIMPHNQVTYAEKGSRQVETHAKEEKRAYTLCVASSADGDFLPFQQIWSGKTKGSLPKADADGMEEALAAGFHFTVANSPKRTSHFSTLKTMQEWMTEILAPYIKATIEANHLPSDQRAILLIDCYPVHLGLEFCTYVWDNFPNVFLIFVPANCTGIFQPADVGLQRVIKHQLRQAALKYLVDSHTQQLDTGLTPDQVKFTTSLPTLRDASVRAIVDAWEFMAGSSGRDVIRRAWEKCTAKEWSLAPEVVTSRRAKAAYQEYIKTDQIFRDELVKKIGDIDGLPGYEAELEERDDNGLLYDTSEVPLEEVVRNALNLDLADIANSHSDFCVSASTVDADIEDNELLRAVGDTENIWAFDEEYEQQENPLETE